MVLPNFGPASFKEQSAADLGERHGYVLANALQYRGRDLVVACGFVRVELSEELCSGPTADDDAFIHFSIRFADVSTHSSGICALLEKVLANRSALPFASDTQTLFSSRSGGIDPSLAFL